MEMEYSHLWDDLFRSDYMTPVLTLYVYRRQIVRPLDWRTRVLAYFGVYVGPQ